MTITPEQLQGECVTLLREGERLQINLYSDLSTDCLIEDWNYGKVLYDSPDLTDCHAYLKDRRERYLLCK